MDEGTAPSIKLYSSCSWKSSCILYGQWIEAKSIFWCVCVGGGGGRLAVEILLCLPEATGP